MKSVQSKILMAQFLERLNRLDEAREFYASALLGVVHYWWLVKADVSRPARYAAIVALLLAVRVWFAYNARHVDAIRAAAAPGGRLPDRVRQTDAG